MIHSTVRPLQKTIQSKQEPTETIYLHSVISAQNPIQINKRTHTKQNYTIPRLRHPMRTLQLWLWIHISATVARAHTTQAKKQSYAHVRTLARVAHTCGHTLASNTNARRACVRAHTHVRFASEGKSVSVSVHAPLVFCCVGLSPCRGPASLSPRSAHKTHKRTGRVGVSAAFAVAVAHAQNHRARSPLCYIY